MQPATASAATLAAPAAVASQSGTWINGRGWDIRWLLGSALIGPVILAWVWAGGSSTAINLAVTALIGGPHLFATYTATWLDPRFRRRHLWVLVGASILVPALVVYLTFVDFQVLLSVFIFAASAHVLQQNAFITDVYRTRSGLPEEPSARWIDYGLLMICIYPVAAYKIVNGSFALGDVTILIPAFLMTPATYWAVWAFFGTMLALWLAKTRREWRAGVLNRPKTLLIGMTTLIAFTVPIAASGSRLELAFQSVNAWHSIQYLGLVWCVQMLRKERGQLESRLGLAISGRGKAAWRFYGLCLATTVVLLGAVYGVVKADPFGLTPSQYYYMGVLSCLLVHYVLDAYLFAVSARVGTDAREVPYAALAAA